MKISILRTKIYLSLLVTLTLFALLIYGLILLTPYLLFILLPFVIFLFYHPGYDGLDIDVRSHPRLKEIIDDVSETFSTNIDEVRLLPGTTIHAIGLYKNRLHIGIGTLRVLSEEDLKSILLHEFAHFDSKDTIFSHLFYTIDRSLARTHSFIYQWYYIPLTSVHMVTWILLRVINAYRKLFQFSVFFHNRQTEYRCDIVASSIIGKERYAKALLKYSKYSYYFMNAAERILSRHIMTEHDLSGAVYPTIHNYFKKQKMSARDRRGFITKLFSSHPGLDERLDAIDVDHHLLREDYNPDDPAIALLEDYEKIEQTLARISIKKLKNRMPKEPDKANIQS